MYRKLLRNDIKNNVLQTFSIAFFIVLAAAFIAAAGQLTVQLTSSINNLFEEAKTPHLMQMHTGKIDYERMKNFVGAHPEIKEYQILDFLNIDNSLLAFNSSSLKDSVYDNGFSVQSPKFDFLLDLEGNLIRAKKDEVYAPTYYHKSGIAEKGDVLRIKGHKFHVAGFVRDSQMNSSLSESRRFIVSSEGYEKIRTLGTEERLIEFRLKDPGKSSKIESAYDKANLEADGPPFMTYTLFKIVNAFSDGITIAALIIISILIICISLLCIRFALLAKLEEDYRELAVLKAIGIPHSEIKKLFMGKYLFIAGTSSILGFIFSFAVKAPFLHNMKIFFGETSTSFITYIVALLLSFSVFLIIALHMNRLCGRIKTLKLEPSSAGEKDKCIKSLSKMSRRLLLVISDIFARRKIYSTMVVVVILSIFVLTVPMSIYSTISDKEFVNYLGLGSYDVRIDMSQIEGKKREINQFIREIERDGSVKKFGVFKSKSVYYAPDSGPDEKIWIDFGNQKSFPIKYIAGEAPSGDRRISLSRLKADEISKNVGDTIDLVIDGKKRQVRVSGIFSDITNGGKTAKADFETDDSDIIWMIVPVRLEEGASANEFIEKYRTRYSFAKMSGMKEYLDQTFGDTIMLIKKITFVSFVSSIFLIFLITVLFMRMIFLKDKEENALLKAIGFTDREIRVQYFMKAGAILFIGILIGNLLAVTAGDKIGSVVLSLIGVSGVEFVRNVIFSYIAVPATMLVSTLLATYVGIRGLKDMNISSVLKEDVE